MHPNILAAEGWIELGNYDEAAEELHNCPPPIKSTAECLKVWIRIYAARNQWREVEMLCERVTKRVPEDQFIIFRQVEAFHKQGKSREAFAALQYAPGAVKNGPEFFYLFARVLCALEEYSLALSCLGKAFDLNKDLRIRALEDPEFEKVWLDLQEG